MASKWHRLWIICLECVTCKSRQKGNILSFRSLLHSDVNYIQKEQTMKYRLVGSCFIIWLHLFEETSSNFGFSYAVEFKTCSYVLSIWMPNSCCLNLMKHTILHCRTHKIPSILHCRTHKIPSILHCRTHKIPSILHCRTHKIPSILHCRTQIVPSSDKLLKHNAICQLFIKAPVAIRSSFLSELIHYF